MSQATRVSCCIALAFSLHSQPVDAATGDVEFGGTIADTCIIRTLTTGGFNIESNLQRLGSDWAPAVVSVTTNTSAFSISIENPSLSRPAADVSPIDSLVGEYNPVSFSGNNGHLAKRSNVQAPQSLNPGQVTLNTYMSATKSGNNVFSEGTYTGSVTLRCE